MRVRSRGLTLAVFALAASGARAVTAQGWDDRFRWYVGGHAGVVGFETPSQTRAWVPTVGGSLLVVAKRTGLLLELDEGLGSNEATAFGDNTAGTGIRNVTFDRLRKYSAILTAYPIRGSAQPYLGVGFGLLQVVNPQPSGFFTSPVLASVAKDTADSRSADGFMSFVAGLQFRVGRMVGFGQYQITTSPASGHLLRGPTHGLIGGLRFSLGGAKEGLKGGGY